MRTREHYFIYPKDKRNNKTKQTICILMGVDCNGRPRAYYGITSCSNEDQFCYEIGRTLAYNRAIEAETSRLTAKETK